MVRSVSTAIGAIITFAVFVNVELIEGNWCSWSRRCHENHMENWREVLDVRSEVGTKPRSGSKRQVFRQTGQNEQHI